MADQPIRILIIDDEQLIQTLIGGNVEMLGYTWQAANNPDEALLALREAEIDGTPFSVVTIDMQYGEGKIGKIPFGKTILQQIKSKYPNVACIMISGSGITPHEILDMRDDYELDYYISKDWLDSGMLKRGIQRALERVKPLKNARKRQEILEKALEKNKDNYAINAHNLAQAKQKKAQKGINTGVDVENEIEMYQKECEELRRVIEELKIELQQLESD